MKVQSKNVLTMYSPLISYYTSSNEYLIKKYSENLNDINLEKSNNFIKKNSYLNQFNNENKEESKNSSLQSFNIENTENENKDLYYQYSNINTNNFNPNINNFNYIDYERQNYNLMNNNNNQCNNLNNNLSSLFSINKNKLFFTEMYGRKGWICIFCNNFSL